MEDTLTGKVKVPVSSYDSMQTDTRIIVNVCVQNI